MAIFSLRKSLNNYDKMLLNDCTICIRKNLRNSTLEEALAAGKKGLSEKYHLTSIKASKFACVFKFAVEFSGCNQQVFYKEYLYRSMWDFAKHILRPSRANRAFWAGLMLQENGFDVPEVVVFGEEKSIFFCGRNFLLTKEIENAQQLSIRLSSYCQDLTKEGLRDKRELIRAFGKTIGKMHALGIFHGDLRLGNILVRQDESGRQFFFLDNERTRKLPRLPGVLRLKNLVQVNMFRKGISNTDRSRFFKAYLRENPTITPARKIWVQKIINKTNRRLTSKNKSLPR